MKKGQQIEFNCYNQIVKGTYLYTDGDLIYFKCTHDDLLKENIGTEQRINKRFLTTK